MPRGIPLPIYGPARDQMNALEVHGDGPDAHLHVRSDLVEERGLFELRNGRAQLCHWRCRPSADPIRPIRIGLTEPAQAFHGSIVGTAAI